MRAQPGEYVLYLHRQNLTLYLYLVFPLSLLHEHKICLVVQSEGVEGQSTHLFQIHIQRLAVYPDQPVVFHFDVERMSSDRYSVVHGYPCNCSRRDTICQLRPVASGSAFPFLCFT